MRLLFTGDVVLKEHSRGNSFLGEHLNQVFQNQDILCCDFECPVYTMNQTAIKKRGPSDYNEAESLDRIKAAGFNMVTMANNHIMDYGQCGLKSTIGKLKLKDFRYCGAGMDEDEIYHVEKIYDYNNGIIVGIISVAEHSFGTSFDGEPGCACFLGRKVENLLKKATKECDYLIIVCHGGAEEVIVPLPEFRDVYKSYIDRGADLVIAHHPHVIQGRELYLGKEIYYSLGNFAYDTDKPGKPYNPIGLCVCVEIDKKKMNTKEYTVRYQDGQVEIIKNNFDFEKACKILKDKIEYNKILEEFCLNTYSTYFKNYFAAIVGLDLNSRENIIKFAEHRMNGESIKWDELFIYHNVVIETNRWICMRAIKLLQLLNKE